MRNQLLSSGLLGVLAASVTYSVTASPQVASAATPLCYLFPITINGTVSSSAGTQRFTVKENALFRNTGVRNNPAELWIIPPQDPNTSSVVGQLRLMSNSVLASNAGIASSRFDLERAVLGNNQWNFTLLSDISFQLTNPNVFTAPGVNAGLGGLGGLSLPYLVSIGGGDISSFLNSSEVLNTYYLVPRQGQVSIAFQSGQIFGSINIVGAQVDNANNAGQYQAQFTGTLINYFTCP